MGNLLGDASARVLASFLKEFPGTVDLLDLQRCRITEQGLRTLVEAAAEAPRGRLDLT